MRRCEGDEAVRAIAIDDRPGGRQRHKARASVGASRSRRLPERKRWNGGYIHILMTWHCVSTQKRGLYAGSEALARLIFFGTK